MVVDDLSDEQIDLIFRSLADATRRDIVKRTLVAEVSVSGLAEDYDMSFAAVQKHVAVLESAGLVTKHQYGRERRVRANLATIHQAQALLDQYEQIWKERITQLDALLAEDDQ
ncbi:MAG TPA: metalloregulator ArsR/SmtB family transcription factor [Microthrixaceae bacterium]|nr:metalloregulator ArsR/SmtB family transcription factor [Microthrixaceae bacterium]